MQLDAKSITQRLCDAVGVRSERELSLHLGLSESTLGNRRRDGGIPLKEAVSVACEHNVSLDWLVLGKGSKDGSSPSHESVAASEGIYRRAARDPELTVPHGPDDDPDWAAYNRRAQDVLYQVVEGVEGALNEAQLALPPGKKAELVAVLFEMYASAQAQPSRHHILRLVRSAS